MVMEFVPTMDLSTAKATQVLDINDHTNHYRRRALLFILRLLVGTAPRSWLKKRLSWKRV
jgi:hypothetical protein